MPAGRTTSFGRVLTAIAIIPSAPVMLPELAGAATAEVADLSAAVLAAADALPPRWVAVGVGPAEHPDVVVGPHRTGTFAGYGADVRVTLAPEGARDGNAPTELPLCALITGWVRGLAAPRARAEVRVFAAGHDTAAALERGRRLRTELDEARDPIGVLVVADGAHTLTPAAPGGYDPSAAAVQDRLDAALADGDAAALTGLPPSVVGRVAFAVLAGLSEPGPSSARELYRGAPYGVGYFAGVWRPRESARPAAP